MIKLVVCTFLMLSSLNVAAAAASGSGRHDNDIETRSESLSFISEINWVTCNAAEAMAALLSAVEIRHLRFAHSASAFLSCDNPNTEEHAARLAAFASNALAVIDAMGAFSAAAEKEYILRGGSSLTEQSYILQFQQEKLAKSRSRIQALLEERKITLGKQLAAQSAVVMPTTIILIPEKKIFGSGCCS